MRAPLWVCKPDPAGGDSSADAAASTAPTGATASAMERALVHGSHSGVIMSGSSGQQRVRPRLSRQTLSA